MKKNLFFATILCIGLIAIINSCVKDTFTEQDAYDQQRKSALQQDSIAKSNMELEAELAMEQALLLDSLKKVGGVINYSVAVVNASESSWLSVFLMSLSSKGGTGMDGVTVTIAQHGVIFTATTGASGIASFKDLRIGTANVNVKKTGFTEVDFVVDLPPLTEGFNTNGSNGSTFDSTSTSNNIIDLVRHVATMVPVFSTTSNLATITGIATVETDLTNVAPEPAANVKVIGTIDVDDPDFWARYIFRDWETMFDYDLKGDAKPMFEYYGLIIDIAFHTTVSTATTGTDGSYTLQVPSSPDGLPIILTTDEFAANQTLLLPTLGGIPVWGPQTVRTMFGTNTTASSIPELGITADDRVQSAYVTFSDPTGSPAAQPTEKATATAVLTSSGIVSINITDQGEGYTQPPLVRISKGSAVNSVQAEGTAVLSGGQVTSVTIDSPGSGYKPNDTTKVYFTENLQQVAAATPKFGYSVATIPVTGGSSGYTAAPSVIITSNSGTGAAATAVMTGYVDSIRVTSTGAGYTAIPVVNIATGSGTNATATATMTTDNPVHSVFVPFNTDFWTRRKLGTLLTGGGGSGARTDSTTLSSAGRLQSITLTNVGAGYNDNLPPTVTISGGGGTGAVAHATSTGGVLTINIDNQGQGYTAIPTVTIGPAPTGGTNATATALIEFQVTGVPLLANGNGYSSAPTVEFETAPQSGIFGVTVSGVVSKLSMGVAKIAVVTAGTEYSAAPAITITPSDGVVGTAATATSFIAYIVKAISVTNGGTGYEDGDIAVSLSAAPAGATAAVLGAPTFTNGKLKRVILTVAGMGYTAAPHVILTVTTPAGVLPTKQAEMTATVSGGQVTGITIDDPGEGYVYASNSSYAITISTFKSGAAATANPNPESGKIAFIQVDDPGAGYSVVPTVEIRNDTTGIIPNSNYNGNANGFGSGATATVVVVDGRVTAINITNAGAGYYYVPTVNVNVTSAVMKAMGVCDVSADGRITDVSFPAIIPFTTKGFGYDSAPTLTFTPSVTGKGTGAVGVAVIVDGKVDDVIMTNQGSGYVGKNYVSGTSGLSITPGTSVWATSGKSHVRDLDFGTGVRTVK